MSSSLQIFYNLTVYHTDGKLKQGMGRWTERQKTDGWMDDHRDGQADIQILYWGKTVEMREMKTAMSVH
jgi:hypothetical protein